MLRRDKRAGYPIFKALDRRAWNRAHEFKTGRYIQHTPFVAPGLCPAGPGMALQSDRLRQQGKGVFSDLGKFCVARGSG